MIPRAEGLRVIIAGGGVAGVEALMALADLGEHRLRIDVVSPRRDFVLRPQLIAAPWGGPPLRVDLAELTAEFGAAYHQGTVHRVELMTQTVVTSDGLGRPYDLLLVATGATPGVAYAGVRTVGFGGLPAGLAHDAGRSLAIVVPPSTGWTLPAYQLALLAAHSHHGEVRVITPEAAPMEVFGETATPRVAAFLERHDVRVELGVPVTPGAPDACDLADTVISLPMLHGPRIPGLPFVGDGFIPTTPGQHVRGCANVFAAGDVTAGRVKQGGLAAHQAEQAATSMVRQAGVEVPDHVEPATLRGKLVAGGETLYLRRVLDGDAAGAASDEPLWQPEAAMVAWRLSRWLAARSDVLGGDALGPIARPAPAS